MNRNRLQLPYFLVVMLLMTWQQPLFAQDYLKSREIESSNNELLKISQEIFKTNTELLNPGPEQSKFSKIRVALYNCAASSIIGSGLIATASERWGTIASPKDASDAAIKSGPLLIIIGNSVVVGGLLTEMVLDRLRSYRVGKNGTSYKSKVNKLKSLYRDYRRLESKRAMLVTQLGQLSAEEKNSIEKNGKFLQQLHNLSVADTAEILRRKKYYSGAKIATIVGEAVSASSSGYVGGIMAMVAISKEKAILAGPAGIGFVISGATLAFNPLVSHFIGKLSGRHSQDWLKSDGLDTEVSQIDSKQEDLIREVSSLVGQTRLALESTDRLNTKDTLRKAASSGIVGGTLLAGGIQLTNASYSFDNYRRGADVTFSKQVAIGDTTYIPGASIWLTNSFFARKRPDLQVYTFGKQNDYLRNVYSSRKEGFDKVLKCFQSLAEGE